MTATLAIAHVVDSMEVGGAEVVVSTLARIQAAAGHRVSIHCMYEEGPLAAQLRKDGIAVFVHGPAPIGVTVRGLRQSLRQVHPDVVHCHNAAATIYGAAIARLLGVRMILGTRHNVVDAKLVRQEIKFWIIARLFCRTVVSVSEAVRQSLLQHPMAISRKLSMIRNGAAAPGNPAGRRGQNGFRLVNVARLAPVKDHRNLLRAVALARKTVSDLHLCIVGDGAEMGSLREFAREAGVADCVSFAGEQKEVGPFLDEADMFVLSSVREGLPISLLEAMARGLPAISTRVGGIPEVADISGACTLVPPSDSEALAEAIRGHAAHRENLEALGASARRCYQTFFSPEGMADAYEQLYRGGQNGSQPETSPRLHPEDAV